MGISMVVENQTRSDGYKLSKLKQYLMFACWITGIVGLIMPFICIIWLKVSKHWELCLELFIYSCFVVAGFASIKQILKLANKSKRAENN